MPVSQIARRQFPPHVVLLAHLDLALRQSARVDVELVDGAAEVRFVVSHSDRERVLAARVERCRRRVSDRAVDVQRPVRAVVDEAVVVPAVVVGPLAHGHVGVVVAPVELHDELSRAGRRHQRELFAVRVVSEREERRVVEGRDGRPEAHGPRVAPEDARRQRVRELHVALAAVEGQRAAAVGARRRPRAADGAVEAAVAVLGGRAVVEGVVRDQSRRGAARRREAGRDEAQAASRGDHHLKIDPSTNGVIDCNITIVSVDSDDLAPDHGRLDGDGDGHLGDLGVATRWGATRARAFRELDRAVGCTISRRRGVVSAPRCPRARRRRRRGRGPRPCRRRTWGGRGACRRRRTPAAP